MNDEQLLRYSRHILLEDLGVDGQERITQSHALVVGAGGLGSPVLLYLASAGVGRITVMDPDAVDLTNLQRQVVHGMDRLGTSKAESAKHRMALLNPEVQVNAIAQRADEALLAQWVPSATIVLDCSDNFLTRHAVNAACVRHGKPLVSGAALRWDAQVSVFDARQPQAPCYACVFPPDAAVQEERCATLGVFAPLVGIIGSMQAAEALKLMAGSGTSLAGRLQMLDARRMEWSEVRMQRSDTCPVCGPHRTSS
ncbi:MAG: HesA/MoeB/ThiF family protein [Betaproteobacteria bacterium]|nr:HesA/MoeB/ThiF family protein [Betaproteobacteria bacterium]